MLVEMNVGTSKKLGQPNYGSVGAHADLKVVLDSSDPAAVAAEIARAYAICSQAVEAELTRLTGDSSAPAAPAASAQPMTPKERIRHAYETGPAPASDRRMPTHRWQGASAPQTGKQLYGWLKDEQAGGHEGLIRRVEKWARLAGISGRIVEWSDSVVAEAATVAQRLLERAPAGANGTGHG
jgi:hypothetical protein